MKKATQQIKTAYDNAAEAYSKKYSSMPTRKDDVDQALSMSGANKPHIFEIGYGDGREAAYITSFSNVTYSGIDISDTFYRLASRRVPTANLAVGDVHNYEFPLNIDIAFAFASLLHSDKAQLTHVLKKLHAVLNPNGIVYLSLKVRDEYQSEELVDEYSSRLYYFYNRETLLAAAGVLFEEIYYDEQAPVGDRTEPFLTIAFRKV